MTREFDAIVIGTGQSGPSLASRLASQGRSVAIVERAKVGGGCVNYGCIPTKALVASARAAWVARNSSDWGIETSDVRVDLPRVKARMREISGKSNRGVETWMKRTEGVELVRGHAKFVGEKLLEVDGETLTAPQIFLNVGARSSVPEIPGLGDISYWNSTGILESETLPDHLVVVGGSYIGLEFGQMYRRFGSQVTVIERGPRLISREDPDVSDGVREILESEGVAVKTESDCIAISPGGSGVEVKTKCENREKTVRGSHLLVATGRTPNTDDLGCEAAGIQLDERGYVKVDGKLKTSAEGIWAMGDCNGQGAFTHTSFNDYEIVADHLFGEDRRSLDDRIPCYGLYIDPPLGRVGMTERQALDTGRKILVGKRPMSKVGRATEKGETRGFMKALVDAETREILGAAVLGVGGDEVVQMFLPALYAKAPYTLISEAVAIHPTVSELLPTMLQSLEPLES